MNAKVDIVFFGDSLTYYGDFSSIYPDKVVCNLGMRDDTIRGMIDRVEQVRTLEPKIVFLMTGIKDVASSSVKEFAKSYELLFNTIFKVAPLSKLIVQNLLPVKDIDFSISCNNNQITNNNDEFEFLASKNGLLFIDVWSVFANDGKLPKDLTIDGIHLKSLAYSRWYDVLKANDRIKI